MGRSESRKRTALVALRLLPEERDALRLVADSAGVSVSAFIRAAALAVTWEELVTAAVHEVFPMGVADVIAQADAFGALADRVRERSQLVNATPCDVLREIDEGDQWLAGRVDEPAAFLAAKVREL